MSEDSLRLSLKEDSLHLLLFMIQFNEKALKDFHDRYKDREWGKEIVDLSLIENRKINVGGKNE